ncbi:HEAT repeat containing protein [Theileria orientalis]|uniref:HEAT repeat containing protein n=1 Tax=Theileria orientalis TaxID=68886 RepID=A0A976M9S3_THEOR|nr:HEAT repeat containing protein [Theileria orientalis]
MVEKKRFKFQSSSKIAKSIRLSTYDDIVSFISKDVDGSPRCFRVTLTNLLRVKDLLKFQNELRELQKSEFFTKENRYNEFEEIPLDYYQKPLRTLLKCAKDASNTELDYICRLLAAYFKDYGDSDSLKLPFDELLEIIEINSNLNSKPIFTLVLTYFKSHTSYILKNIHEIINEFLPWLNSRNQLIKRLSMECLGTLLRRAPVKIIKEVIEICIHTDGAEKIIFTIIENVDGNFTSKIESLFTYLFEELIPSKMEDVSKVVENIRNTIHVMSTHAKDSKIDLTWLKSKYELNVVKLKEERCKIEFKALCTIIELNLEMLLTFDQNKITAVKNYPLITRGECFKEMFMSFIVPLLRFSNQKGKVNVFEDLCSYLLRAVRSESEATQVIEEEFGVFLTSIDHNTVGMNNINSFLSLFEWRLKTNDMSQISHILLVLANIIEHRDIFHPLIVNTQILKRVLEFVNNTLAYIECGESMELFINLYSIMYGLSCINKVRIKLKASMIENEDKLFERVLTQVIRGLEHGYDSRVLMRTYKITFDLLTKDKCSWIEKLLSTATKCQLFHNYFIAEFLVANYNNASSIELAVSEVLETLPNENDKLRINAIELVKLHYSKFTKDLECLKELMEMECTPNDVENSRKKCMTMSRAVNAIDFEEIRDPQYKLLKSLVKKVLMSQYFVKFSPLWEGAFSANTIMISKLKAHEKGLNETWNLYYTQLRGLESVNGWPVLDKEVESAVDYKECEKTDLVTIQYHLLRVITEIVSTVKDRDAKIEDLVDYTLEQFRGNTDFLKNAICTLSDIMSKFNRQKYREELFDCCVTAGLKSTDPKVREASLNIVAKRYNKMQTKRLSNMCTGNHQQISALTSKYVYGEVVCETREDAENLNMSIGIEIRLLVPRIYQHSNVSHGSTIIDYFLNFEPKYVSLMLIELLPNEYSNVFTKDISVVADEAFSSMFTMMKFHEAGYTLNLPNVLTTLNLIIKRLINNLKPQSRQIMEFCCIILEENANFLGENSNILVERAFKIMIELVGIFKVGHFIELFKRYSKVIVELGRLVGIDFVLACTSQAEHTEEFCTGVVRDLFPGIFDVKLSQKHMMLADNIYNLYPVHLKKNEQEYSKEMLKTMVSSSETLLNSMCTHCNYNCHLISCIVELDLGDEVRSKALSIFLKSLPPRAEMTKLVKMKNEVDLWKKILSSIDTCMYLVDGNDAESVGKIWDFVDNILSLVPDNRCRKGASELLKKIPSTDDGVSYTGEKLCLMNGVSVELRLDLDMNVEIITDVVQELNRRSLSFRCINSLLTHSLFLLSNHNRDPGVRRSVAELSFKIMEITKERLGKVSELAVTQVEETTYVISSTLFPFIRRSLAGNADDSLVCLCLELLEHFVHLFSSMEAGDLVFAKTHPDLLANSSVASCFHQMRELQKYKRCKGIKQLQSMVESGCFSTNTLLKLIIPTALQFLIQRNVVRHIGLSDMSKQCLIASCQILPVPSFIKILKKLLQTYSACKLAIVLTIFSSITSSKMDSLKDYNGLEGGEGFKDNLGVGLILSRLKKMSLVEGKKKVGDVPLVEVFECIGNLLRFYPESVINRELVKQCRILAKFLASRNRDVRRLSRTSLISLAKPFRTRYVDVFIKELFTNMTKGYKCSVLIFTIYSILNKVLDDENILTTKNQIRYLYTMILDEIARRQEKDDSSSKIDEARHPKSSQLISLISQYSDSKVVENNFAFLISLLNGNLVSHKTDHLEYTDKFLRRVNELIVSATSGLIQNNKVDQVSLSFKIFMTTLPKVRGIEKNIDQFPKELVEKYRRCKHTAECKLKETAEIARPEPKSAEENQGTEGRISRLKDRYTVMPGAATGRSFEASLKRPGFENHIFAPPFVNSCIRLFNNTLLNRNVNTDNALDDNTDPPTHDTTDATSHAKTAKDEYRLCEFCVLISFLSEEVVLQKSSCTCLLKLCKLRPELIEDYGHVLASHLVDRMGSLELVGSEELAKDHIGLISIFFKTEYLDILYEAWDSSNRSGKLVESLLLQIETNLNRPKLHTPLFKLLLTLMQTTITTNTYTVKSNNILGNTAGNPIGSDNASSNTILNGYKLEELLTATGTSKTNKKERLSVYFNKEFYRVTYEIMIRMVKGEIATKSTTIASKVVGYSFILLPMDEDMRSKRFALLLKHVNSPDPQVRIMTTKTLLVITRELPGHVIWKRYASLLILALLPRLVSEEDPNCRKFLQMLVTHVWSRGSRENKNQMLDVVAHFVRKMKKHVHLAFSFFVYLALKREDSVHDINRLNLTTLEGFLEQINDDHWQNCYYWLMLLEHLLSMEFDINKEPARKIWEFVVGVGLESQHPWILASSLRTLARVICMKKVHEIIPNFNVRVFELLKSSLRNMSTYYGYLERHRKLEEATQEAVKKCIDVLSEYKDKSLERLTSRICYILRCDLGRRSECTHRISLILEVLSHLASKELLYERKHRVMLLKVIIALFRVAHTKPAGVSHKLRKVKDTDTDSKTVHADRASTILDCIENSFADSPAEYLKLLSFARNYVLKSRLVKKKQIALAMVTNTKLATLRKLKKNRKKRRKFRR